MTAERRTPANGQFPKGVTGNPAGRPRQEAGLTAMARMFTRKALFTAAALLDHPEPAIRLRAVEIVLDRGHGKAKGDLSALADGNALQHLLAAQAAFGGPVIDAEGVTETAPDDLSADELARTLGITIEVPHVDPMTEGLPLFFGRQAPRIVRGVAHMRASVRGHTGAGA